MSAYPISMAANNNINLDGMHTYMSPNMEAGGNYNPMSQTFEQMGMTTDSSQQGLYTTSPMSSNFPMQYPQPHHDPGGGGVSPANSQIAARMAQATPSLDQQNAQRHLNRPQNHMRRSHMMASPFSLSARNSMSGGMQSPAHVQPNQTAAQHEPRARRVSGEMQSYVQQQMPNSMQMVAGESGPQIPQQAFKTKWSNAYSTTGFDMLAILMRVATRRNPQINIGPVDLSCAFVVCDIQKHDLPIVYCSDMFERLTGYSRHEILGRNCRFLQAPDGKVQSGVKRKYVDDKSVLYLKNQINDRAEAQLSLINYRKGGQPFMNLLTMIPIAWDTDEFKYFVGFQVDLVEQPNSVSGKNPGEFIWQCKGKTELTCAQMARTRSITTEVPYLLIAYPRLTRAARSRIWAGKPYHETTYHKCLPQSATVRLTYRNGFGTRFCLKTPTTWSMSCH